MSEPDFPAELIARIDEHVNGIGGSDYTRSVIKAVLRESGHAEMVAALKDARHYASIRFETPLLAIIDAALTKAGAQ